MIDYKRMNNRDLARVNIKILPKREIRSILSEVGNRRRLLKNELCEFDELMRNITIKMTRI